MRLPENRDQPVSQGHDDRAEQDSEESEIFETAEHGEEDDQFVQFRFLAHEDRAEQTVDAADDELSDEGENDRPGVVAVEGQVGGGGEPDQPCPDDGEGAEQSHDEAPGDRRLESEQPEGDAAEGPLHGGHGEHPVDTSGEHLLEALDQVQRLPPGQGDEQDDPCGQFFTVPEEKEQDKEEENEVDDETDGAAAHGESRLEDEIGRAREVILHFGFGNHFIELPVFAQGRQPAPAFRRSIPLHLESPDGIADFAGGPGKLPQYGDGDKGEGNHQNEERKRRGERGPAPDATGFLDEPAVNRLENHGQGHPENQHLNEGFQHFPREIHGDGGHAQERDPAIQAG